MKNHQTVLKTNQASTLDEPLGVAEPGVVSGMIVDGSGVGLGVAEPGVVNGIIVDGSGVGSGVAEPGVVSGIFVESSGVGSGVAEPGVVSGIFVDGSGVDCDVVEVVVGTVGDGVTRFGQLYWSEETQLPSAGENTMEEAHRASCATRLLPEYRQR